MARYLGQILYTTYVAAYTTFGHYWKLKLITILIEFLKNGATGMTGVKR
jgi:hypothetical protein